MTIIKAILPHLIENFSPLLTDLLLNIFGYTAQMNKIESQKYIDTKLILFPISIMSIS